MSKIILKKLRINKKTSIEFNAKLNYVVGNNGSGKTTLFHLIQYILGLRINSNRLTYLNSNYAPYLICEFNNKIVKITRKLDSNIIVFEGDKVIEVRANSIELNELYSELLGIKSLPHYNDRSALEILGFSFYSDFEFKKNNTERHEIYNKILGYNPDYLNAIKNDIKNFESQISLENQSIKLVEQYKKEVERSLEGLIKVESIEPINKLLNSEFSKIREQLLKNYELLLHAQSVYKKEKIMSEEFIEEKLSVLEPFFYQTIKNMNFLNDHLLNLPLREIMRQKNFNTMSFDRKNLVMFVLRLTFCRDLKDIPNGLGLLVTDDMFSINDSNSIKEINDKIYNISIAEEIQYIGFSSYANNIPKEYIIFDISPWQGGGLFERQR